MQANNWSVLREILLTAWYRVMCFGLSWLNASSCQKYFSRNYNVCLFFMNHRFCTRRDCNAWDINCDAEAKKYINTLHGQKYHDFIEMCYRLFDTWYTRLLIVSTGHPKILICICCTFWHIRCSIVWRTLNDRSCVLVLTLTSTDVTDEEYSSKSAGTGTIVAIALLLAFFCMFVASVGSAFYIKWCRSSPDTTGASPFQ